MGIRVVTMYFHYNHLTICFNRLYHQSFPPSKTQSFQNYQALWKIWGKGTRQDLRHGCNRITPKISYNTSNNNMITIFSDYCINIVFNIPKDGFCHFFNFTATLELPIKTYWGFWNFSKYSFTVIGTQSTVLSCPPCKKQFLSYQVYQVITHRSFNWLLSILLKKMQEKNPWIGKNTSLKMNHTQL